MPYITIKQPPMYHQITFDEILSGDFSASRMITANETNTRTYFTERINPNMLTKFNIPEMISILESFCEKYEGLYSQTRTNLYDKFYIPKKSGGLREINAPKDELMVALRELKMIFETKFFAMYHTSAFAYVPGRSTIDAIRRHQQNDSKWFLKTDFSNFFGNTTPDYLLRSLSMIFPFSEVVQTEQGMNALIKALDLCFLNGGLPQGTPISPMLTNLMMIPIDHTLYNKLRDLNGMSFVYTRYADDIQISSRVNFKFTDIVDFIKDVLRSFNAPFSIKNEKTRYGSRSGSNWNLGLMLNKDNDITIGHRNKKRFRAMICNYIMDKMNNVQWELHDVQVLAGNINYYGMIEPSYVEEVINYNDEKFKVNVRHLIKEDLR